eukprot:480154-Amphidinium_carterae.1
MQVLPGPFGRQGAPVRPSAREERKAPGTSVLSHPGGERESGHGLHTLRGENGEIGRREASGTSVLSHPEGTTRREIPRDR